MSNQPTIEIPAAELAKLRETFRVYTEYNKRDRRYIVNTKAIDWAFKSIGATEKASAERLAWELGQTASSVGGKRLYGKVSQSTRTGKNGRTYTRTTTDSSDTLAARIINARLVKKGEKPLFGKDLERAVRKLIASRIKAISFVKSGWLSAAKVMQMQSPDKASGQGFDRTAKVRGAFKGSAKPANLSENPSATIINSATKDSPLAAQVANDGMVGGLRLMMADMRQYIERKMQETINKKLNK